MKNRLASSLRSAILDENGQVIPWAIFLMVMFIGMAGLVVDVGDAYYQQRLLQSSTDAAALAGGQGLPTAATASANATSYSSMSGNKNAFSNLSSVGITITDKCLAALTAQSLPCLAPANANAIKVVQTASVPTYFVGIFGVHSIPISATAMASMAGVGQQTNLAVIIDTTASMATADNSCGSGNTRLTCSKLGVQALLKLLNPCQSPTASCTPGVGGGSLIRASLFTFPNVDIGDTDGNGSYQQINSCPSGTTPIVPPYTIPSSTGTSYAPTGDATGTYQISPFESDYRTNDAATTLNSASTIVRAIGAGGCAGMPAKGGDGTYLPGAIYAAEAALVAQKALFPGSQNIILIASDGDNSATKTAGRLAGSALLTGLYTNSSVDTGSYYDECGQSVTAAKAATTAGTLFISIGYGSPATGCATDTVLSQLYYTDPCVELQNMASTAEDFFTDTASGCTGINAQATSVVTLFQNVAALVNAHSRLIPDTTT